MKRLFVIVMFALGAAGIWSVGASCAVAAGSTALQQTATQTTTFAIDNMTCALCPVTVRKAMEGVKGVKSVTVDFDAKTATVVFDPSLTNLDAIAAASTDAGYPARTQG